MFYAFYYGYLPGLGGPGSLVGILFSPNAFFASPGTFLSHFLVRREVVPSHEANLSLRGALFTTAEFPMFCNGIVLLLAESLGGV